MKRLNQNILVFIISALIIFSGLFSKALWAGIKDSALEFLVGVSEDGVFKSFSCFSDNMEKISSEKLSYHSLFMDINSVFLNSVNTKVVVKDSTAVVKTSSGYLANPRPLMKWEELEDRADKVRGIYEMAERNNAKFLYVMAPSKGYSLNYPSNIEDFTKENCDNFAISLKNRDIPNLNLIEKKSEQGITDEEMFFITDHHWRPEYALWASGEICKELDRLYGFEYDKKLTDISNYEIKTYKDWFLGSQGKKVGSYFTSLGRDDINIILPKFETSLSEAQPLKNHYREGAFSDTVMYMENIEKRDLYNLNPYVSYSGGDFREQIITNKLKPDGAKVLLIRDSFACAAAPFLSLNTKSLYITDVRDYEYYVGSKINVYEYIEKIKPDYVLVLYNGISTGEDLFDFD
ncbi:MAG: hypothetical protein E7235_07340 [Lachnospiraceae bacterium]|nr:hypothetical protein [Lachnospiraceae bacterium]